MPTLRDLLTNYNKNINLKGKLNKSIKLNNGKTLRKGTVSDLLIEMENDMYHFESKDNACTVTKDEITIL